jgi:putative ABC transport system ATP-binding protein
MYPPRQKHVLFFGHTGSGKTTELLHYATQLAGPGRFCVVQLDITKDLDRNNLTLIERAEDALRDTGNGVRIVFMIDGTDKLRGEDTRQFFVHDAEQLLRIGADTHRTEANTLLCTSLADARRLQTPEAETIERMLAEQGLDCDATAPVRQQRFRLGGRTARRGQRRRRRGLCFSQSRGKGQQPMAGAHTSPDPVDGGDAPPPARGAPGHGSPETRAPETASGNAVFRVRGVTKVYRMGEVRVEALRGVDLDLYAGELAVLLGPSGSGKSTLLNILGGLDRPTAGQVLYGVQDLATAGDRELTRYRRHHVGFVFQFYNLIPSLTARENVAVVTEIARDPMPPAEALTLVGLGARLDHFPAQLSGGEQQRVAIARAVAKRPDVLLCDEPTGALDSTTGIVVLEVLERVNHELGTTTAVITHNAGIAGMADRVITLADGRIAEVRVNATRVAPRELSW